MAINGPKPTDRSIDEENIAAPFIGAFVGAAIGAVPYVITHNPIPMLALAFTGLVVGGAMTAPKTPSSPYRERSWLERELNQSVAERNHPAEIRHRRGYGYGS
jgi:hypothetical protein